MAHDRVTGEPILMDLSHSPSVYERRYHFPWGWHWTNPAHAWAALREVMPWEALAVSAIATAGLFAAFGRDLGQSLGVSIALALVTIQMLRFRIYLTASSIVRQRGLFLVTRMELPRFGGRLRIWGHGVQPFEGERRMVAES